MATTVPGAQFGLAFINVLKRIQDVAEVCTVFYATANPLEEVVAQSQTGRGALRLAFSWFY